MFEVALAVAACALLVMALCVGSLRIPVGAIIAEVVAAARPPFL